MTKTVTVLSGLIRPLVEDRLPDWVEPRFFQSQEEAMALAPEAEIGWFDMYDKAHMAAAITAATRMKWLNSIYAGVDGKIGRASCRDRLCQYEEIWVVGGSLK